MTQERRRPSDAELEAIERFRARLNRQNYTPEELLERRRAHARLVQEMREELARVRRAQGMGTDELPNRLQSSRGMSVGWEAWGGAARTLLIPRVSYCHT